MTCVVALRADDGRIIMGADSAGVGGYAMQTRLDPKIYRVGEALIGFTTSFRMGQLLGYGLSLPAHRAEVPVENFMVTSFIDAVRTCLKNGGYARRENEAERGGTFLVAYRGRIFYVEDDYQVGESSEPYNAVGCGFDLALGSLHATGELGVPPERRITMALEAASRFSAGVRPPFIMQELKPGRG